MDKELSIVNKLFIYRDAVMNITGDEYKQRIQPYIDIIKKMMEAHNESERDALLRVGKAEQDAYVKMMFAAATLEMISPAWIKCKKCKMPIDDGNDHNTCTQIFNYLY